MRATGVAAITATHEQNDDGGHDEQQHDARDNDQHDHNDRETLGRLLSVATWHHVDARANVGVGVGHRAAFDAALDAEAARRDRLGAHETSIAFTDLARYGAANTAHGDACATRTRESTVASCLDASAVIADKTFDAEIVGAATAQRAWHAARRQAAHRRRTLETSIACVGAATTRAAKTAAALRNRQTLIERALVVERCALARCRIVGWNATTAALAKRTRLHNAPTFDGESETKSVCIFFLKKNNS